MQAHRQQRQQRQHSPRPNSIKQRGSLCDTISAGSIWVQLVHREQQQMQHPNTADCNRQGYLKRDASLAAAAAAALHRGCKILWRLTAVRSCEAAAAPSWGGRDCQAKADQMFVCVNILGGGQLWVCVSCHMQNCGFSEVSLL